MVPKYPEMSYLVKRVCRYPDVYKIVLRHLEGNSGLGFSKGPLGLLREQRV